MILGVDRLDYTKGLVARLMALEVLFSQYPQWIGKVTFLQVAVPSRIDVKVRILKKGHKNWKNLPVFLNVLSSSKEGDFFKMFVAFSKYLNFKEYQELKGDIDKLVGHINGRFSTPAWSPIR